MWPRYWDFLEFFGYFPTIGSRVGHGLTTKRPPDARGRNILTMARTSQFVQVGKRKLELSNLTKVLFPDDGIVKAEVVEYYLKIAPTLLGYIKGRPLTLVRFPDGIYGETFYQKTRPDWAPDWIDSINLGEDKKAYIMATEQAALVWLANLACLELHQIHAHKPEFEKPDYIVYDLDPPENYPFEKVVEIAFDLKDHIEGFGYQTFAKTTGGKGVHIVTPIHNKWEFHVAFQAARDIAQPFVDERGKTTTLHIKKESRKGRVLIDIYRNRPFQSIISPYSVRGRSKAPVSMPLNWEDLSQLKDPKEFTIHNAADKVIHEGDPWEGMAAYAVDLHTDQRVPSEIPDPPPSKRYKSPEKLKVYSKKRDFEKTPEPQPQVVAGEDNAFVVHRHHASRLHYDLRLEDGGTLKSWAVPRGLPPRPGIKRLAVATEDHPLKYLTFEGTIPKREYGGGDMWIYATGKYEYTKKKKDGFYFYLHSPGLNAEYRIYNTKDKEYLLERVDPPQVDYLTEVVEFMLSQSSQEPPESSDFVFEVKWDGIRAMISIEEGEMRIRSRNQHDITQKFPELLIPEKSFRATNGVFDAEIVCLDAEGRPNFKRVINRVQQSTESGIKRMAAKYPVHCYIFDCLFLDGRAIINEPLYRRREWLADVVKKETPYRVSDVVEDGAALFEASKQLGLEGIMAKDKTSRYHPGKRSPSWFKIKVRHTVDCLILGFTEGRGDRSPYFGALQIGEIKEDHLIYRGKVGSGFDTRGLKKIHQELKKRKPIKRPIKEKPLDDAQTTWIKPELYCEIQFASITPNNTYREPVFVRMRPDK